MVFFCLEPFTSNSRRETCCRFIKPLFSIVKNVPNVSTGNEFLYFNFSLRCSFTDPLPSFPISLSQTFSPSWQRKIEWGTSHPRHLAFHLTMILLLFFGVFNYSFVILTFSFVYKRVSYLYSFISWVKITSLLVILLPISSYLFIQSIAVLLSNMIWKLQNELLQFLKGISSMSSKTKTFQFGYNND